MGFKDLFKNASVGDESYGGTGVSVYRPPTTNKQWYIKNGTWWIGDYDSKSPATGLPGPKGDQGDQGPVGPSGNARIIQYNDLALDMTASDLNSLFPDSNVGDIYWSETMSIQYTKIDDDFWKFDIIEIKS